MSDIIQSNRLAGNGSVGLELLDFDDDLAELSDRCAFLCDAVVSILQRSDCIDPATLGGIHSYSEYLKQHIGQMRNHLSNVRSRVPIERQERH